MLSPQGYSEFSLESLALRLIFTRLYILDRQCFYAKGFDFLRNIPEFPLISQAKSFTGSILRWANVTKNNYPPYRPCFLFYFFIFLFLFFRNFHLSSHFWVTWLKIEKNDIVQSYIFVCNDKIMQRASVYMKCEIQSSKNEGDMIQMLHVWAYSVPD